MRPWAPGALFVAIVAVLVAVPIAARREVAAPPRGAATVIVLTANNEQIRSEFGAAFERWHLERHGSPVAVVWSTPGGAGEIRRMLEASAVAALRQGIPVGGSFDVLFGGGAYEYEQLSKPITVDSDGASRSATVLEPIGFDEDWLRDAYGDGLIGGRRLFDAGGHWFGAALSAFGIVYNNDSLSRLGVPAPTEWSALADPRLRREVALVNPAQSASVATAMDTILRREGWDRGWAILRRAAANARSIAASGPRAPADVSQGEAAMAICIDFYGRYQQQAVSDGGAPGRIGYVDPAGRTAFDPDPIAVLRGAPHPELARRFVEFVLSPEGQRLWQLRPGTEGGPREFALRRLPVRRALYETELDRFIDRVDPWKLVRAEPDARPGFRALVAPLFVAMAVDNRALLREAWDLVALHPEYPRDGRVLTAANAKDPHLRALLEAFDAMPAVPAPGGARLSLADPANLQAVGDGWLRGGWKEAALWRTGDPPAEAFRRILAAEVERNLRHVIELAKENRR